VCGPFLTAFDFARAVRKKRKKRKKGYFMARPTKLTTDLRGTVVTTIRTGATIADAAKASGVHPLTVRGWLRRDPSFAADVRQAEHDARSAMLAVVTDATDWRFASVILERRWPSAFGGFAVTDPAGDPVALSAASPAVARLRARLARLIEGDSVLRARRDA